MSFFKKNNKKTGQVLFILTQYWKSQLTGQRRGDAVFGIRANWKEQWCRLKRKTDVAQTSFTPACLNTVLFSMHWLAWTFKRPKHYGDFFSPFGKAHYLAPDLHRWTTNGNKTRTCYSKQIYSGADTSRHVTQRWKPRDAINYLHY